MMMEKVTTRNNQDFQYFSESELTELRNESFVHSYREGQVLFYPGDPRNHLILSVSGVIKIGKNNRSDNFFYLYFMKKQAPLPRIRLFQNEVRYDFTVAYTDIEAVFVPVKLFERFLQNSPQQLIHWIQRQPILLKESMIKIQRGTANGVCERIVTSLAVLLNDLGERVDGKECVAITCPITINDVTRMSGITRETASSVMKKLVQMNRISYSRKFLAFLDTPFSTDRLSS